MHVNKRAAWLVLALALFFTGLACESSDRILSVAQARTPTSTRTRTPRPTFTAVPSSTATPIPPTNTPQPTPTRTATRRPSTATPRPPTPKPLPTVPPAPQPTVFNYQYHAYDKVACEHSGNAWIKGSVVYDKNDPDNTKLPGIKLRLSSSPDGGSIVDIVSIDDFAFVLSGVGEGARPGTYYVWVIDGSGNRISQMSPAITLNGLSDSDPKTCWAAWVYFYDH